MEARNKQIQTLTHSETSESVAPPQPAAADKGPVDSSTSQSKSNSQDHISLSSPEKSPDNLPGRSSASSDGTNLSHGSSPEEEEKNTSSLPEKSPGRLSDSSDGTIFSHDSCPREEEEEVKNTESETEKPPTSSTEKALVPLSALVKSVKEEMETAPTIKKDPVRAEVRVTQGGVGGGGGGGGGRRVRPASSILRRAKRDELVIKAGLGFRVFGFLFCVISFSILAADRHQGWALDSFERYIEFRYSMAVNVIGFVYSGVQALDLSYNLVTGKYIIRHPQRRRYYFDFFMDQVITYLLISASSSAATRIDDWQSNWGKDRFPDLASASVSMSFLAFVALAASSLISGYALCTCKSM